MRALFVLCLLFVGGVAVSILIDFVAHDAIELPGFDYLEDQGAIGAVVVLAVLNLSVVLLGSIVREQRGRATRVARRRRPALHY